MIDQFRGPTRWLSNFGEVPVLFAFGIQIPTTEHGYQAAKCEDPEERIAILKAPTPGKAKRLGMKVKLREDWNDVRDMVMYTMLRRKFNNRELRDQLLDTGEELLVEGNDWGDEYWGAVKAATENMPLTLPWWPPGAKPTEHDYLWCGENNLGILLMQVRKELRELRGL